MRLLARPRKMPSMAGFDLEVTGFDEQPPRAACPAARPDAWRCVASNPRTAGASRRVGIVLSRFNPEIGEGLLAGALRGLSEAGVADDDIVVVTVPGALETPLALQRIAQTGDFDALVALGAVIRGETYHFEIVANESARGVVEVALAVRHPDRQRHPHLRHRRRRRGARMQTEGLRGGAGGARDREPVRCLDDALARAGARASSCCRASTSGSSPGNADDDDRARSSLEQRRLSAKPIAPTSTSCGAASTSDYDALRRARSRRISTRKPAELSPIERAILAIGAWELDASARHSRTRS